ncbi:MAG: DUF4215 domain-containing protein [Myxococcota bacterium]
MATAWQPALGEQCDDGGTVVGDGCDGVCRYEPCAHHELAVNTTILAGQVGWDVVDAQGNVVMSVARGALEDNQSYLWPIDLLPGAYRVVLRTTLYPNWSGGRLRVADHLGGGLVDELIGDPLTVNSAVPDVRGLPFVASCDQRCGDGVVHTVFGEQCDDANDLPGDGCEPGCVATECGPHTVRVRTTYLGSHVAWEIRDAEGQRVDGVTGYGDDGTFAREVMLAPGDYQFVAYSQYGDWFGGSYEVVDPNGGVVTSGTLSGTVRAVRSFSTRCDAECGDGVAHPALGELCDDGNTSPGDGCNAACQTELCGNGIRQPELGEACDDGNIASGDGCSTSCVVEFCGDGTTQATLGETCDDGAHVDADGCDADCNSEVCGNARRQAGEGCDDGNLRDGDGCDASCHPEVCGNGILQYGEACDDGNTTNGDGCSASCRNESCGDGAIQAALGEECDDGNTLDNDGCASTCRVERCGDGVVHAYRGEVCDDGNQAAGDGCSDTCTFEGCAAHRLRVRTLDGGDSLTFTIGSRAGVVASGAAQAYSDVELPLQLADGPHTLVVARDPASYAWYRGPNTFELVDGVGTVLAAVDMANGWSGPTVVAFDVSCGKGCGDAWLSPGLGEQCDDGATASGDGCDGACQWERCAPHRLHVRASAPSVPVDFRVRDPLGNVVAKHITSEDGAYPSHADIYLPLDLRTGSYVVEMDGQPGIGWPTGFLEVLAPNGAVIASGRHRGVLVTERFTVAPSCQTEWCGDGVAQSARGELCDDGNNSGNDGCDSACRPEVCGDGILHAALNERCDDGNGTPGDGCDNTCQREACAPHLLRITPDSATSPECRQASWVVRDAFGDVVAQHTAATVPTDPAWWPAGTVIEVPLPLRLGGHTFELTKACPGVYSNPRFSIIDNAGTQVAFDGGQWGPTLRADIAVASCATQWCGDVVVQSARGEQCDDGNRANGDGCDRACRVEACGNGVLQPENGEECDDGNTVEDDGCTSRCLSGSCGDGIPRAEMGEQCDDANLVDGDGCTATCQREICAPHVLRVVTPAFPYQISSDVTWVLRDYFGEVVAQRTDADPKYYTNRVYDIPLSLGVGPHTLTLDSTGYGIWPGRIELLTHDGTLVGVAQLQDSHVRTVTLTVATCAAEWCGDGMVQAAGGEQCDDGNRQDGDGCSASCIVERCGDGLVHGGLGENCDDGATGSGDGCDATCRLESCAAHRLVVENWLGDVIDTWTFRHVTSGRAAASGRGVVIGRDGAPVALLDGTYRLELSGPAHSHELRWRVVDSLGGVVSRGQVPAGAAFNTSSDPFTATCAAGCGDGVPQPLAAESCDDGNIVSGDGCGSSCVAEACAPMVARVRGGASSMNLLWRIVGPTGTTVLERAGLYAPGTTTEEPFQTGPGHHTLELISSGIIPGTVEIDDAYGTRVLSLGNLNPGGFPVAMDFVAGCRTGWCGNGVVEELAGEECDDGNAGTSDGCGNCMVERCGDGIRQAAEQCDDGNADEADGCTTSCTAHCAPHELTVTTPTGEESPWKVYDQFGVLVAQGYNTGTRYEAYPIPVSSYTAPLALLPGAHRFDDDTYGTFGYRYTIRDVEGRTVYDGTNPFQVACIATWCGDGVVNGTEECDDGNRVGSDGCSASCVQELCGDGITQASEACDDGNADESDGCTTTCARTCAPHVLRLTGTTSSAGTFGRWRILDGNDFVVLESDWIQVQNLSRDVPLALWSGTYRLELIVPNASNRTFRGEVLDTNGALLATAVVSSAVSSAEAVFTATCDPTWCGDGITEAGNGEECDDGNNASGDGCRPDCRQEICGDGIQQATRGEQCDDGNVADGDGCTAGCVMEACTAHALSLLGGVQANLITWRVVDTQGNVVVPMQYGPPLLPPNLGSPGTAPASLNVLPGTWRLEWFDWVQYHTATATYAFELRDGAGAIVTHGNVVAIPRSNPNGVQPLPLASFTFTTRCGSGTCGDHVVDLARGEDCDDGNLAASDGCTGSCQRETCAPYRVRIHTDDPEWRYTHWLIRDAAGRVATEHAPTDLPGYEAGETYETEVSLPTDVASVTAHGVGSRVEVLTVDGNTPIVAQTVTPAMQGIGATLHFPVVCQREFCGDGVVQSARGEECDDGNRAGGDGCTVRCNVPRCGDAILQPELGELCDDGNTDAGDGCDPACQAACAPHILTLRTGADASANWVLTNPSAAIVAQQRIGELLPYHQYTFPLDIAPDAGVPWDFDWWLRLNLDPESGGWYELRNNLGVVVASGPGRSSSDVIMLTTPVCVGAFCGDAVWSPDHGEACDDGNLEAGDGCSPRCVVEGCGDGVLQTGEECDDGNTSSGDGCSDLCVAERCAPVEVEIQYSSPGTFTAGWRMLDPHGRVVVDRSSRGYRVPETTPATREFVAAPAGSNIMETRSQLNDVWSIATFIIRDVEGTELARGTHGSRLPYEKGHPITVPCITAWCGDGVVADGEACDDGNMVDNDGCSADCVVEVCGDGILQTGIGEQCDDGDALTGDGCSDTCQFEDCAVHTLTVRSFYTYDAHWRIFDAGGNEVFYAHGDVFRDRTFQAQAFLPDGVYTFEQTLARPTDSHDGTSYSLLDSLGGRVAGDVVNPSEPVHRETFVASCAARCGDGVQQPLLGEQCDDGDITPDDGCSETCQLGTCGPVAVVRQATQWGIYAWRVVDARGDVVATAPDEYAGGYHTEEQVTRLTLPPGVYQLEVMSSEELWTDASLRVQDAAGEELVDVVYPGDVFVARYQFTVACALTWCGDGATQPQSGEECDDEGYANDDGCSATCRVERCGDGVRQLSRGEACDDGDLDPSNGCDGTCQPSRCPPYTLRVSSGDSLGEREFNWSITDETGAVLHEHNGIRNNLLLPAADPPYPAHGFTEVKLTGLRRRTYTLRASTRSVHGTSQARLEVVDGRSMVVASLALPRDGVFETQFTVTCDAGTWCGDALVGSNEQCDDGNEVGDDGCSDTCRVERCGDGVVQPALGEACDDGDGVAGDGCAACVAESCAAHTLTFSMIDCESCVESVGWEILNAHGQPVAGGRPQSHGGVASAHALTLPAGTYRLRLYDEGTYYTLTSATFNASGVARITNGVGDDVATTVLNGGALETLVAFTTGCGAACGNGVQEASANESCDDGNTVSSDGCSSSCVAEACTRHRMVTTVRDTVLTDWLLTNAAGDVVAYQNSALTFDLPRSPFPEPNTSFTRGGLLPPGRYFITLAGSRDGWGGGSLTVVNGAGASVYTGTLGAAVYQRTDSFVVGGCTSNSCGDGVRTAGEQCDDGNAQYGDGCSPTCRLEACGDGQTGVGEQCDDGNTASGDGCSAACRREYCGDGVVQPGEACDDANTNSNDACTTACQLNSCGNGVVDPGEQCDTGTNEPGYGCNKACEFEACTYHSVYLEDLKHTLQLSPNETDTAETTALYDPWYWTLYRREAARWQIERVDDSGNVLGVVSGVDGYAIGQEWFADVVSGSGHFRQLRLKEELIDRDYSEVRFNHLGDFFSRPYPDFVMLGDGSANRTPAFSWLHQNVILPPGRYQVRLRYRYLHSNPGGFWRHSKILVQQDVSPQNVVASSAGWSVATDVILGIEPAPELVLPLQVGARAGTTGPWRCGAYCGDGQIQAGMGEQCDDGNQADGDGCDAHCQAQPHVARVRGGTFVMGSPVTEIGREADEAPHVVTVGDFEMYRHEADLGHWVYYMQRYNPGGTGWWSPFDLANGELAARGQPTFDMNGACGTPLDAGVPGERCAVGWLNWHDAAAYANAVSLSEGLETCYSCTLSADLLNFSCVQRLSPRQCHGYRLPTEAEWEYAARSGGDVTGAFPWGGDLQSEADVNQCLPTSTTDGTAITEAAWACYSYQSDPVPVPSRRPGLLPPNALGLHDMAGNQAEWVHDYYGTYSDVASNPSGPATEASVCSAVATT